ncbi:MAG TPA: hypothetical protein PLT26_11345 [Anaerolineaceae bacterium]|nr:hypothetical protein [Anaerolineaceae bacterium]HQH86073.1 hypothetical protein [Anaerolineaceae bacterium]
MQTTKTASSGLEQMRMINSGVRQFFFKSEGDLPEGIFVSLKKSTRKFI